METNRLTEAVTLSPTSEGARLELAEHLAELQHSAATRGLVHLEAALGETLERLERESFGPEALAAVSALAARYGSLAALPSQSGTHPVVQDGSSELLQDGVDRILGELPPHATIVVQDASSLFEVELKDGRLIAVTRTTIDGAVTKGAVALSGLLAVRSGRFVVAEPHSAPTALDSGPGDGSSADPSGRLKESEIQQDSLRVVDPVERENMRAQSAVAMHQEPANEALPRTSPIWRFDASARREIGASSAQLEPALRKTANGLGLAFWALLAATIGFLIWQQAPTGTAPASPMIEQTAAVTAAPALGKPEPAPPPSSPTPPETTHDLAAFAGTLRVGVDPALHPTEGQGVLELIGPAEISVEVDGVDRGTLPVGVVLDQGIHEVRYRAGARSTIRFYYVKSGATRASAIALEQGGLVDVR